jgi:hypothetical protein
MKRWQRMVAVGLALGFGPACDDSKPIPAGSQQNADGGGLPDGGGSLTDAGKPIAFVDLPAKLARALCTATQGCYGPVFDLFLNGTDCIALTEQRIRNGTFPMLQGEIDLGKVVYLGNQAQACLDSLAARSCAQMLQRDSPECLAALDGTVALGGACTLDEDCQGKALCKSTTGTCPGQCMALLVAGQACAEDGDCQDGLACSQETRLCVLPAAEGQACEYGAPPCGPGLLCLGKDEDKKTPGTCRTAATALAGVEGGSCDATLGQLCQPGLSCVADSITLLPLAIAWRCMKIGSYLAAGACKPGYPEACASGSYCKTDKLLDPLAGTCTAVPAGGEACGTGLPQCQAGAVCVDGTCRNRVANGVSCAADAMCLSEYCGGSGGCEARLPCR